MRYYNLLLIIILLFSCKNNLKKNYEIDSKSSINNERNVSINDCQKFNFIKWDKIKENRKLQQTIYISDFCTLELKHFFNEQKNEGGIVLFVNDKKADKIANDFSHRPIIFGCKENKKVLIFIEELDESGVIGYRVYFKPKKNFIYSGFLNISSVDDTLKFDDNFINLIVDHADKIQIDIIPEFYFNTSNYKNESSIDFKAFISINSGKLIVN